MSRAANICAAAPASRSPLATAVPRRWSSAASCAFCRKASHRGRGPQRLEGRPVLLGASCEQASVSELREVGREAFAKTRQSAPVDGAAERHRRRPAIGARRLQVDGASVVVPGAAGGRQRLPVGLVDQDQVGQLDDAAFDALQIVPAARHHQQDHRVDELVHEVLRLPDAHRLDDDPVVARRLAERNRLPRRARHAPQGLPRRTGPHVRPRVTAQRRHPRFVPEDTPARAHRTRVHRQHRHPVASVEQLRPETLDESALADAGRPSDAEPPRSDSGSSKLPLRVIQCRQALHQPQRHPPILTPPTLHQGYPPTQSRPPPPPQSHGPAPQRQPPPPLRPHELRRPLPQKRLHTLRIIGRPRRDPLQRILGSQLLLETLPTAQL